MTDGVESRMLRAAMSRATARTDREMLELAAKAAGYDVEWQAGLETGWMVGGSWWNPLTDDGDALRLLAVRKLAVSWEYMPSHVLVEDTESDHHAVEQIIDGDRASALRRAATACMAEIGMAMP